MEWNNTDIDLLGFGYQFHHSFSGRINRNNPFSIQFAMNIGTEITRDHVDESYTPIATSRAFPPNFE
jgi:hypothetical protein